MTPKHKLPFDSPWLLAPMEGITDPVFRDCVAKLYGKGDLGGTFTEFVRISQVAASNEVLLRHYGSKSLHLPVGLQLMGNSEEHMAETARRVAALGIPLLDINFGCPSRGARKGCAGSALLDDPQRIESLVRACQKVAGDMPVTAKIRAGISDDRRVEDLARAVENGGGSMLTIHARTREEGYRDEAINWHRVERAVKAVGIPVCGNGGVTRYCDLEAKRRESGCAFVMVGRGALADPWVFASQRPSKNEAAAFLVDYGLGVQRAARGTPQRALSRVKQLLRYWTAADLVADDRQDVLRIADWNAMVKSLNNHALPLAPPSSAVS